MCFGFCFHTYLTMYVGEKGAEIVPEMKPFAPAQKFIGTGHTQAGPPSQDAVFVLIPAQFDPEYWGAGLEQLLIKFTVVCPQTSEQWAELGCQGDHWPFIGKGVDAGSIQITEKT